MKDLRGTTVYDVNPGVYERAVNDGSLCQHLLLC